MFFPFLSSVSWSSSWQLTNSDSGPCLSCVLVWFKIQIFFSFCLLVLMPFYNALYFVCLNSVNGTEICQNNKNIWESLKLGTINLSVKGLVIESGLFMVYKSAFKLEEIWFLFIIQFSKIIIKFIEKDIILIDRISSDEHQSQLCTFYWLVNVENNLLPMKAGYLKLVVLTGSVDNIYINIFLMS